MKDGGKILLEVISLLIESKESQKISDQIFREQSKNLIDAYLDGYLIAAIDIYNEAIKKDKVGGGYPV